MLLAESGARAVHARRELVSEEPVGQAAAELFLRRRGEEAAQLAED
jgi:hypothetical protein